MKHSAIFREKTSNLQSENEHYFVNSQATLSDIPYGKKTMAENGCGPIALYNALLILKKNINLSAVIEYFEEKGATLNARLGTSPYAVAGYLKDHGIEFEICKSADPLTLNQFSENFDTFISIVFMNRKKIKYGLHYICTGKINDSSFISYNPKQYGATLFETLNRCSLYDIKHLYTIGIKTGQERNSNE